MAYTKTNWVDNETPILAEYMNNIEDGIGKNESNITDMVCALAGVTTVSTETVELVTGAYINTDVPDISSPSNVSDNKFKAFLYEKTEEKNDKQFKVTFTLDGSTSAKYLAYNVVGYTATARTYVSGWTFIEIIDNTCSFSYSLEDNEYAKIGFNFLFSTTSATSGAFTLDNALITNIKATVDSYVTPTFKVAQNSYSKTDLLLGGVTDANISNFMNTSSGLVRGIVIPIDTLSNLQYILSVKNNENLYQAVCINYINNGVSNSFYGGTAWGIKQNTDVELSFNTNSLIAKKSDITHLAICFFFSDDGNSSTAHQIDSVDYDFSLETAAVLTIDPKKDASGKKTYVVVKPDGTGDYTNVVDAVANEDENTPILIYPGVYIGTVQAFNKRIILIGTDRNQCIIKVQTGSYSNPPINGSCGYLENLTIWNEYVEGNTYDFTNSDIKGYAFHCENEYGVGKVLEFHHCTLKSDFSPAIGAGLRKDFHLIIDDCELISNYGGERGVYLSSGSLGALYWHDTNGAVGDQYITVKNSVLRSTEGNVICPYTLKKEGSTVYCTFINNVLYDEKNGFTNNIWHRNGNAFTEGNFVLDSISCGNTNEEFNSSYYK